MIEGIIFDLDGTLVDSMWMWRAIDEDFLKQFGHTVPDDLQQNIEGMSFSETALYFKENFCIPWPVEQIKERWNEMAYEKYAKEVPLKAGVKGFLERAKEAGVPLGIATSNSQLLVKAVLDAHHITNYFDCIITGCEVAAGKPAPDIYLKVAQVLGVNPHNCVAFEDVPAGIMAGKAAGMKVYAVDDAFSLHLKDEKCRLADEYIKGYENMEVENL